MKAHSLVVRIYFLLFIIITIFSETTSADISVERLIKDNRFSATTLSFTNNSTVNMLKTNTLFKTVGLITGGFDVGSLRIKKDGQLNFSYLITTQIQSSDPGLCQSLNLKVLKEDKFIYTGSMVTMSLPMTIDKSGIDDYIFIISLNNNNANLKQKECQFAFDIKTNRPGQVEGRGFSAQTQVNNFLTSGTW